jgi:hypothetical protein
LERVANAAIAGREHPADDVVRSVGDTERGVVAAAVINPGDAFLVERIADVAL